MNACRFATCLCLIATTVALSAQARHDVSREQTEFSAETAGVDRPVTIPEDVFRALENDDLVRTSMENSETRIQTPPPSWFSASKVHLADPKLDDLVILAEGQLRGANVITFWVFRKTTLGYELILKAPAHDLEIRKHYSSGYRDIEMSAETAVEFHSVLFRFNGKRYTVHKEKTEPTK